MLELLLLLVELLLLLFEELLLFKCCPIDDWLPWPVASFNNAKGEMLSDSNAAECCSMSNNILLPIKKAF